MGFLPPPWMDKSKPKKRGWQVERVKKLLPIVFPPNGEVPYRLSIKEVHAPLVPEFEKCGLKPASEDVVGVVVNEQRR
jgi:hypothetical protein